MTADMKHPNYAHLISSKKLYTNNYDIFPFKNHKLPGSTPHALSEKDQVKITRQCYHLELDIEGSNVRYQTGDHVGVWGTNQELDVIFIYYYLIHTYFS